MRRMLWLGLLLLAACSAQLGGRNNRSGAAQANAQNNERGRILAAGTAGEVEPGVYPVRLEVYGPDREPLAGATIRVEDLDEVRTRFPPTGLAGVTNAELRYGQAAQFATWEWLDTGGRRWAPLDVGVFRPMGDGYRIVVRVPGEVERHALAPASTPTPTPAPVLLPLPTPGPPMIVERRVARTCWTNPGGEAFHRFEDCPYVRANARAMPCDEAIIEASEHRLCITCGRRTEGEVTW